MSGEDDELEQRKEEVWSLEEVRGGSADTTDPVDTEVTEDTEATTDTSQPADTEDTTDTEKPSDTTDTEVTTDTEGGGSSGSETSDNSVTSDTADTKRAVGTTVRQMAIDAEEKGLTVRDLHNVNVYLYESIYEEMISTFKQLDSEYFQEHGEDLTKNKDFFNAVFRAGLSSSQLREELELVERQDG